MSESHPTASSAREARSVVGSIIATLLCVAVSFGLGWLASSLYIRANADKAAAQRAEAEAQARHARPPTVETAMVKLRELNPPRRFMGHVEPIEATDLRAQISGTIAEVAFKEGASVKAGDLLFLIDPAVYKARVAQAKAALDRAKAASENADRYYARISKVDKRSVTEAEVDKAYADMLESRAQIAQCEADLASAEINLGYTRITAPISGRIGASLLKKGDYVSPAMTSLARIVQTDPVRVVFSVPDKEYIRGARRMDGVGAADVSASDQLVTARLQLADGSIYSHKGKIDFVSNEMSSATASVPVRYSFANPEQLLLSNAYVTVLLSDANPKKVLTIPATAVLSNAKGDFVYVLVNGKAEARDVKLGTEAEGLVAVTAGLADNDEVIVEGVVNVRPGAPVSVIKTAK